MYGTPTISTVANGSIQPKSNAVVSKEIAPKVQLSADSTNPPVISFSSNGFWLWQQFTTLKKDKATECGETQVDMSMVPIDRKSEKSEFSVWKMATSVMNYGKDTAVYGADRLWKTAVSFYYSEDPTTVLVREITKQVTFVVAATWMFGPLGALAVKALSSVTASKNLIEDMKDPSLTALSKDVFRIIAPWVIGDSKIYTSAASLTMNATDIALSIKYALNDPKVKDEVDKTVERHTKNNTDLAKKVRDNKMGLVLAAVTVTAVYLTRNGESIVDKLSDVFGTRKISEESGLLQRKLLEFNDNGSTSGEEVASSLVKRGENSFPWFSNDAHELCTEFGNPALISLASENVTSVTNWTQIFNATKTALEEQLRNLPSVPDNVVFDYPDCTAFADTIRVLTGNIGLTIEQANDVAHLMLLKRAALDAGITQSVIDNIVTTNLLNNIPDGAPNPTNASFAFHTNDLSELCAGTDVHLIPDFHQSNLSQWYNLAPDLITDLENSLKVAANLPLDYQFNYPDCSEFNGVTLSQLNNPDLNTLTSLTPQEFFTQVSKMLILLQELSIRNVNVEDRLNLFIENLGIIVPSTSGPGGTTGPDQQPPTSSTGETSPEESQSSPNEDNTGKIVGGTVGGGGGTAILSAIAYKTIQWWRHRSRGGAVNLEM